MKAHGVRTKLSRLQRAIENRSRGRTYLCCGGYKHALEYYKDAKADFITPKDKMRMMKLITHCELRLIGVIDGRGLGLGYLYQGSPIGKDEVEKLRRQSKKSGFTNRVRRNQTGSSGGLSIKQLLFKFLDDTDGEGEYKKTIRLVKEGHPDSKYNAQHFAYYRSKWRAEQRKNNRGK